MEIGKKEEDMKNLLELFPRGVVVWKGGRELWVNKEGKEALGLGSDEPLRRRTFLSRFPRSHRRRLLESMRGGFCSRRSFLDLLWIGEDGQERLLKVSISALDRVGGGGCLIFFEDVTPLKKANERLYLQEEIIDRLPAGLLVTDNRENILVVNRAFCSVTGYNKNEVIGQTPRLLKSGKHSAVFYQRMWDALLSRGHWEGEIWNRRKNGEVYPEWLSIVPIGGEREDCGHYVGIFSDITQRKARENAIQYRAYHDALTGLPNRMLFYDRLDQMLEQAKRNQGFFALLFLDLDRFKEINDQWGHFYGDQVLKEIGRRLQEGSRKSDTVARIGGDEFTILLPGVREKSDVATVASNIIDAVSRPVSLRRKVFSVGVCIGIALYPEDGETMERLIKKADKAMYASKAEGENRFRFFNNR